MFADPMKSCAAKVAIRTGVGACFVEVTAVSNCEKLRLEID
jgi:hypothetical protein